MISMCISGLKKNREKNQEHKNKNSSIWSRPMHWDLSATKYIMCEISLFDLNLTANSFQQNAQYFLRDYSNL